MKLLSHDACLKHDENCKISNFVITSTIKIAFILFSHPKSVLFPPGEILVHSLHQLDLILKNNTRIAPVW